MLALWIARHILWISLWRVTVAHEEKLLAAALAIEPPDYQRLATGCLQVLTFDWG